jgi:hypothetical protein
VWDIFEIVFGAGSLGAFVRLSAGAVTVATGAVAVNRKHIEYYKKLETPETHSIHMRRIESLMAELREVEHGR